MRTLSMGITAGSGDWLLLQELFERGDPSFVDELRQFDDAEILGEFAPRWIADQRPEARRLLLDYLDRPLNAFRHEPLVKRLFKLAEGAGDDVLMGAFLVAFDRSIRRVQRQRRHFISESFATLKPADDLADAWRDRGFESVSVFQDWQKKFVVFGRWLEPILATSRRSQMPRGTLTRTYDPNSWDRVSRSYTLFSVPDWVFRLRLDPLSYRNGGRIPQEKRKELSRYRLFSCATRNYLRRRAWRYFRKLGRSHPERYVAAVKSALIRYRDEDAGDGLALIDNWGLMHILFHFSPCLTFDDRAFKPAEGHTLAELQPAPAFPKLWDASPRAFFDLLIEAQCRAVRAWGVERIRRDIASVASVCSFEERLALLEHDDADVVSLAGDMLRDDPSLKTVPLERWFELVEKVNPAALEILCEIMSRLIDPERVTLAEAVRLAGSRPLPTARLGLAWLMTKAPSRVEECRALLALTEAESETVRPEVVRWVASALSTFEGFEPGWVLEFLDSRYEDVRAEGLRWFRAERRAHDDLELWQRLMETPYDDVRLGFIGNLEERFHKHQGIQFNQADLDPKLLGLLWASVLLNIARGSRVKPAVMHQIRSRIESHPDELPSLLPLFAVALRSVRGPEMRAGLTAVVRLAESNPSAAGLIAETFPELQFV